jgi:RNA polymerase sigma-70 factor (ECF subfamily)
VSYASLFVAIRPHVRGCWADSECASFVQPIPDGWGLQATGDPAELAAQRETIRLAFVAVPQNLPPRQRAVLILRDVLCWSIKSVEPPLSGRISLTMFAQWSTTQRAQPSPESAGKRYHHAI